MDNISKTFFNIILGLFTGILVVSIIKNDGEINWEIIGYTIGVAILAYFVVLGIHLIKKRKIR